MNGPEAVIAFSILMIVLLVCMLILTGTDGTDYINNMR